MPDWRATKPETMMQHLGEDVKVRGAVVPPIFQNSLFVFKTWESFQGAMEGQFDLGMSPEACLYSRINNPTLDLAGEKVAALEHTECARLFASGMAAVSAAVMASVKSGGHVVAVDTCYGPTKSFLSDYLPRFDVETTFVVGSDPQEVFDALRPDTTLIYLESPSSIVFRLQDLEAVSSFAKERGIRTAIDNSYSSPVFQQPADFGIDIVLHSATKYIGGHSDLVAGALATSNEVMREVMRGEVQYLGASLSPFPSWLILRSMRTIHLRMKAHAETTHRIALWLREQPWVAQVFHPGFDDFPQRDLFLKQMKSSSGLVTFEPKSQDSNRLRAFTEALQVYQLGVSWGGFESLCVPLEYHPMDWPQKKWLVRLFNGLEHPDDLVADIERAASIGGLL